MFQRQIGSVLPGNPVNGPESYQGNHDLNSFRAAHTYLNFPHAASPQRQLEPRPLPRSLTKYMHHEQKAHSHVRLCHDLMQRELMSTVRSEQPGKKTYRNKSIRGSEVTLLMIYRPWVR